MGYENTEAPFDALIGKTLAKVEGAYKGSDEIKFVCADGETFVMDHIQDCCESVLVEDVNGDIADLIDSPITLAEESVSDTDPPDQQGREYMDDSFTWTFYRLATAKGFVVIRWLGESNGYYGERVDFRRMKRAA